MRHPEKTQSFFEVASRWGRISKVISLCLVLGTYLGCDSESNPADHQAVIYNYTLQEVQALAQKMIPAEHKTIPLTQANDGLLEIVQWNGEIKMQSPNGRKQYNFSYSHQTPGRTSMLEDQMVGKYSPLEIIPGFSPELEYLIPLNVDLAKLEARDKYQSAFVTLRESPEDKKLSVQKIDLEQSNPTYLNQLKPSCEQRTSLDQVFYWCPLSSSQSESSESNTDSPSRAAFFATLSSPLSDSTVVTVYFGLESLDGRSKSGTSTLTLNYKRKK